MSQYTHKLFINENFVFILNVTTNNIISISKQTGVIKYENPSMNSQLALGFTSIDVYGVLGIIKYDSSLYLIYVTKVTPCGEIRRSPLYQITEINFVALNNQLPNNAVRDQMTKFKQLIATKGFYFSPFYDITKVYYSQGGNRPPRIQYMFNKEFIDPFLFYKIAPVCEFVSYVINGYIDCLYKEINDNKIITYIISRKNTKFVENNVNETELLLVFNQIDIVNYVMYSICFNVDEDNLKILTLINNCIINQHSYTVNTMILSEKTDNQSCEMLMTVIKQSVNKLKFYSFEKNQLNQFFKFNRDLINDCGFGLKREKVEENTNQMKCFLVMTDNNIQSIEYTRSIVFETICFFFSKYCSMENPESFLGESNINKTSYKNMLDGSFEKYKEIIKSIDNKDYLTYEQFHAFSKNIITNPFPQKTVYPTYQNNLQQNQSNVPPQLIQSKSITPVSNIKFPNESQMSMIEKANTTINDDLSILSSMIPIARPVDNKSLSIYLLTWNVHFLNSDDSYNQTMKLQDLLFPQYHREFFQNGLLPDIYMIGLQEIIELDTTNILSKNSNENAVNLWTAKFNSILSEKYVLLKSKSLVGILLLFFVKKEINGSIIDIKMNTIKTGLFGALGNKGSCNIKFEYRRKSFAFSVGHLSEGETNNKSRIKEMNKILNNNFDSDIIKFSDNDYWFIFGDLNFRLDDVTKEYINDCIKGKCLELIKSFDQFLSNKEMISPLITEGNIAFFPTYKFVERSRLYDISERIPSYCDRILFKKNDNIHQLFYDSIDFPYSDHQPVVSLFTISL